MNKKIIAIFTIVTFAVLAVAAYVFLSNGKPLRKPLRQIQNKKQTQSKKDLTDFLKYLPESMLGFVYSDFKSMGGIPDNLFFQQKMSPSIISSSPILSELKEVGLNIEDSRYVVDNFAESLAFINSKKKTDGTDSLPIGMGLVYKAKRPKDILQKLEKFKERILKNEEAEAVDVELKLGNGVKVKNPLVVPTAEVDPDVDPSPSVIMGWYKGIIVASGDKAMVESILAKKDQPSTLPSFFTTPFFKKQFSQMIRPDNEVQYGYMDFASSLSFIMGLKMMEPNIQQVESLPISHMFMTSGMKSSLSESYIRLLIDQKHKDLFTSIEESISSENFLYSSRGPSPMVFLSLDPSLFKLITKDLDQYPDSDLKSVISSITSLLDETTRIGIAFSLPNMEESGASMMPIPMPGLNISFQARDHDSAIEAIKSISAHIIEGNHQFSHLLPLDWQEYSLPGGLKVTGFKFLEPDYGIFFHSLGDTLVVSSNLSSIEKLVATNVGKGLKDTPLAPDLLKSSVFSAILDFQQLGKMLEDMMDMSKIYAPGQSDAFVAISQQMDNMKRLGTITMNGRLHSTEWIDLKMVIGHQ